jgi:penicillin-binding protein 1B
MQRALQFRQYANAKEFPAPDGVVTVTIDPQSGKPATPYCPEQKPEVFVAGTEPVGSCPLHGNGKRDLTIVSSWDDPSNGTQGAKDHAGADSNPTPRRTGVNSGPGPVPYQPAPKQPPAEEPKKKGIFGKLKDVFK